MLICFGIKAIAGSDDACYVKTGDKVYFGQDLKMGLTHVKIISPDGTVVKVNNHDITAYKHHNKLYELLPVICEKGDTICKAFLEYMTSRSGLNLYRYTCCEGCNVVKYAYFVFKDGKYYLRIDKYNADAIMPFFGIKDFKIKAG